MLTGLSIRDIVLIERLDLEFAPGLTVLTGETGAGKSVLLDALGLALGLRAERELLRFGASQGTVVARFAVPADHPVRALLFEQGLVSEGEEIVLRRQLAADGKSRAFIDDTPVATQLLRRVGGALVAVHGQHDTRGLLDPSVQRGLLDAFAGAGGLAGETRAAWQAWRSAEARRRALAEAAERQAREADYLRHRALELERLAVEPGEEARLSEARARLLARERLSAAIAEAAAALGGTGGARERLATAARRLERVRELAGEALGAAIEALERAQIELDEAEAQLESFRSGLESAEGRLETIENRLFALKDAARKYRVPVDELPALLEATRAELARLDADREALVAAERTAAEAEAAFRAAAARLSRARRRAAEELARAVCAELAPLKLERARFEVALEPLPEADWGPEGGERIAFLVATNPGTPPGPLSKIASGGELSRLMLALELVLARLDPTPTLIFDEIDTGVGGATADAIGARLARLARDRQVLVVTHAPQIAARASRHFAVRKLLEPAGVRVEVVPLEGAERRQEIARMLAGAQITEAARAAAASLLELAGGEG
ncbi:MAG: DNA repair protein RecN [Geminicoccaceae bacterium]|nr:DNA repair protein RecN [Geminicoccaceae bacterium]